MATSQNVDERPITIAAAASPAGHKDDDHCVDRNTAMRDVEDPVPITQNEDVEPSTLEKENHLLQRTAEYLTDDDYFDSIIGHEWNNGVLMLNVR